MWALKRTISDLEVQYVITESALREAIDTLVPMIDKLEDYPYSSYPYYANEKLIPPGFLRTNIVAYFLPHPFDNTKQAYCFYCLTYKQIVDEDT